jgi:hypothetical protein
MLVRGVSQNTLSELADDANTVSATAIPSAAANGTIDTVTWDGQSHRLAGATYDETGTKVQMHDLIGGEWVRDELAPDGKFFLVADERVGSLLWLSSTIDTRTVWERFDGTWRSTTPLPIGVDVISAVYVAATGEVAVIGDREGGTLAFVREWSDAPFETCANGTSDLDGDGLAGCADPDCYWACTACPPGTTCRFDLEPIIGN